jgi:hypothetical protein
MAWSIPASMSLAAITGVLLVGDIARVPLCLQRQMWSDGDSGNLFFPPQLLPWGGGKNLVASQARGIYASGASDPEGCRFVNNSETRLHSSEAIRGKPIFSENAKHEVR